MSQENVEIVRGWFARLSAGNPAPDLCDPRIEWRPRAQEAAGRFTVAAPQHQGALALAGLDRFR
jgi:hypothetical protein